MSLPRPNGNLRVLVVERHRIVRAGLRCVLERDAGINVVGESTGGAEIAEIVDAQSVRLVLLSVAATDGDAMRLIRRLKRHRQELRVLVLSPVVDDLERYLEAGANGFLLQSCGPEELRLAVRLVGRGQLVIDPAVVRRPPRQAVQEAPAGAPHLSERERGILRLLAQGATSKEIAAALGLSASTVDNHRARILAKLGAANTAAAVRTSIDLGLLPGGQDGGQASAH